MGSLYKRGNIWWLKYYKEGRLYRESSGTNLKHKASRMLKDREGDIVKGKLPAIEFERFTFDELANDLIRDYRINGRKTIKRARQSVNHLKVEFEGAKATAITTDRINDYIDNRLSQGAANATINRELAALKRMLNLGARQTPPKVDRVP